MAQNKPIGKLLEELGYITSEQIDVALDVQKASPKYLGEILQDLDFVTSSEIAEAISLQNGLEYLNLDTVIPEDEALKLIPQNIAQSKLILPLEVQENRLLIATHDVNDLVMEDYLQKITKMQIGFVVADKSKIAYYSQIHYYQLDNPIETEIKAMVKQVHEGREIDVVRLVEQLLNNAIKDRVTDIHITPELTVSHVFYRIDGVLKYYYALPIALHQQVVARIKIMSDLDISEQRKPQDGAFGHELFNEKFDLRVSTLPTNFGENVVMRLLGRNASLFNLRSSGFSEENVAKIENYFRKPYGIILLTGPTGSGKTTTLYAALRKINSLQKNVLTIEDPIEYKFSFIKQTQLNIKAGYTFDAAIRAFMRQDPDVMLIGEIRDRETAELAVRASITGHLVLSTLHTNDAVGTIPRLGDLGVPPYLIGSGLLAIIAQRLVRRLCKHCKTEVALSPEALQQRGVSKRVLERFDTYQIYEAKGCPLCHGTGFIGRQAIIELLEVDEEIEALIANGATTFEIMKRVQEKGMLTMREDGHCKVLEGLTTFSEIERVVS